MINRLYCWGGSNKSCTVGCTVNVASQILCLCFKIIIVLVSGSTTLSNRWREVTYLTFHRVTQSFFINFE